MKQITAPMAAIIVEVKVKVGDLVQAGMEVIMLESMKMQIPVSSESAGKVVQIHVKKEDFVNEGQAMITLE